ncbi:MAG: lipid kinase [Hyphomicrobiales bacterium]|nr:lipid kinase [Hyphomicrobiales bacterium]
MAPRRVLLIINAQSRSGQESLPAVLSAFATRDISVVRPSEEESHDCRAAIARLKGEVDAVVVGGGDGSLNCAARGLLDAKLPFGIIPLGTANDLARTLGLPTPIDEAVGVIASGQARWIDVGFVNGHPFFNVASLGISADLAQELTSENKKMFGPLSYAMAAVRVLSRARPFRAEIISPQSRARVRTFQIAVGNGVYYGGGMAVHESASIDDHQLHLYSLEMAEVWKLLVMAPDFRAGRHGAWQEVRVEDATRFEVRTRHPMPVNADGEIITATPAIFCLRAAALQVFAPARGMV